MASHRGSFGKQLYAQHFSVPAPGRQLISPLIEGCAVFILASLFFVDGCQPVRADETAFGGRDGRVAHPQAFCGFLMAQ